MSARKPKLPKGIDVLPSGKFRVRVSGFPSQAFTRVADAEHYLATLKRAKETGRIEEVGADLQKLRDLAAEHMAASGGDLAERTRRNYAGLWRSNVLTHSIADMPLRMISPRVVEDFRDDLLAAKVGPQSVRRTLTITQTIMERGVRHGRIASNPCKTVKKPSAKRTTGIRPLSPAQVESVRERMPAPHATLVSVLAYAGVRPSEALALTWGDVGERTIRVERAVDPDGEVKPTKTDHMRTVRLVTPLGDDLKAHRVASGNPADAALIFPRADGAAWTDYDYRNWRRRTFQKAARGAGLGIRRPYHLRHSAASLWLHEGISPVQVARWLGHSLAMLSNTYAHVIDDVDPDDRRSAVDMIRAARDKPMTSLRVIDGHGESGRQVA